MDILLRRHGKWLELGMLGPNGSMQPLPRGPMHDWLIQSLSYTYSFCERDGGNVVGPVQTQTRLLAMLTEHGTLMTGIGCLPRLSQTVIPQAGGKAWFQDVSPPLPRPNCYEPDWAAVRSKFQFRPRQEECLQAIVNTQNGVGGVIDATMGFGKSKIFEMLAVLFPHAKIAIAVAGKDIVYQIHRNLLRHTPRVGLVMGGRETKGRVTVYTADSLHKCDNDIDIFLGDEAHELVTEGRIAKMSHLRHAKTFFFSGSVDDRMDGLQARLEPLAGPIIFQVSYQEGVELGLVVPMRVLWLPIEMQQNPCAGQGGVRRSRSGLWRNYIRNGAIANFVQQNFRTDEQVLIAVNTLEHAVFLQHLLPDFTLAYAGADLRKIGRYKEWGMLPEDWQPMSGEERGRLRDAFSDGRVKKAIATSIWSRGVSFDRLSVLVRADGGASGVKDKQWPGRASRIADGKQYSLIVDCADKFDERLWAHSLTRKRHYEALGWAQDWPFGKRRGHRAST